MKVFNIKEVDERYNLELEGGIKLKPFYTLSDKVTIYDDMLSSVEDENGKMTKKDSLNRDFSLIVLTAKLCTNIDFDGMSDNEVYDIVAELRLIETFKIEIDEYLDMPKLVDREESTYNALTEIISSINDKLKDFDMSKIQDGFSGLGGVIGDVNSNK